MCLHIDHIKKEKVTKYLDKMPYAVYHHKFTLGLHYNIQLSKHQGYHHNFWKVQDNYITCASVFAATSLMEDGTILDNGVNLSKIFV